MRAIIVGIEKYNLSGSNLDGPYSDAIAFAELLLKNGFQPDQISLFANRINPASPEPPAGIVAQDPAYVNLFNHLTTLKGDGGDKLIIYWSGHGICLSTGETYLMTADAIDGNRLGINASALSDFLAGSNLDFAERIVILDACRANLPPHIANQVPPMEFSKSGARFQTGTQWTLYATQRGGEAVNCDVSHRSELSTRLFPLLDCPVATWNLEAATQSTYDSLAEHSAHYRAKENLPDLVVHRNNERILALDSLPPPANLAPALYYDLCDILDGETALFQEALPHFRSLLKQEVEPTSTWSLVLKDACDTVQYEDKTPTIVTLALRLMELAASLGNDPDPSRHPRAGLVENIKQWLRKFSIATGISIPSSKSAATYLTVVIMRSEGNPNIFEAQSWKWLPGSETEEVGKLDTGPQELSMCLQLVRDYMQGFVATEGLPAQNLEVEFLVPKEVLVEPFELWPLPTPPGSSRQLLLAGRHRVHLRPIDYLADFDRVDRIKRLMGNATSTFVRIKPEDNADDLYYTFIDEECTHLWAFIGRSVTPEMLDQLDAALSAGIPYVLWLREEIDPAIVANIDECLSGFTGTDFRIHALNARKQGFQKSKTHEKWKLLALSCDRADRIPALVLERYAG